MGGHDYLRFTIESPTRIRLGSEAREQAREYGWTDRQMAEHLLTQEKLRQRGLIQREGEN